MYAYSYVEIIIFFTWNKCDFIQTYLTATLKCKKNERFIFQFEFMDFTNLN